MEAKRKIAQTLLPKNVEAAIFNMRLGSIEYAKYVRKIVTWSKIHDIIPTIEHLKWDEDMWRAGTFIATKWERRRQSVRPKEAERIVFTEPTLLQCPRCNANMVNIDKMVQKRGCDEPATIYASCKNEACKQSYGREYRFRTEG